MADLDEATILKAAQEMAALLRGKLDDYDAASIELARDEAALILGLIAGIAEHMEATTKRSG